MKLTDEFWKAADKAFGKFVCTVNDAIWGGFKGCSKAVFGEKKTKKWFDYMEKFDRENAERMRKFFQSPKNDI